MKNLQGGGMDKKLIVKRIDELIEEKHITNYRLKECADISSTVYQWRKNTVRDATRTPSLRSIEKVCAFLGVSLSYFFAFESQEQAEVRGRELSALISTLSAEEADTVERLIKLIKRRE